MLGADGAPVTKEESDLTGTVFSSALKLVTGKASRTELANELSEKLYGQRGDPSEMAELGIDLTKPKSDPTNPLLNGKMDGLLKGLTPDGKPAAQTGAQAGTQAGAQAGVQPGTQGKAQPGAKPGDKTAAGTTGAQAGTTPGANPIADAAKGLAIPDIVTGKSKAALSQIWGRLKPYSVELSLVPVVFMFMVWKARRRRRREASFVPEYMAVLPEGDSDDYEMKHAVHDLNEEDFELVAAMIYQRQGYRVSIPAALGGGRTGNFKLARKAERLIVVCHNADVSQRVQVDQVRALHEAMADGSITGGIFIASCGYTWDARHFAKTRKIKLINAKTLDALLDEARTSPDEEILAIKPWIAKFMTKAEMTAPHCPECEAEMDQVKAGEGSVWLCNQRPECGGKRAPRKFRKALRAATGDGASGEVAVFLDPGAEYVVPMEGQPVQKASAVGIVKRAEKEAAPQDVSAESAEPAPAPSKKNKESKAKAKAKAKAEAAKDDGKSAAANLARSIVPMLQRIFMPGSITSKKSDSPEGERSRRGAIAGITPAPAPVLRGTNPQSGEPSAPKPATAAAANDTTPKNAIVPPSQTPTPTPQTLRMPSATAPATPAEPPKPAPDGTRTDGSKRNGGLLDTALAEFKRRGFRLEQKPLANPSMPPVSERGGATASTQQAPPNPLNLRLETTKPAPQKPESNAA